MLTHIRPSRPRFTSKPRPQIKDRGVPGSKSGTRPGPPSAQSPFTHPWSYRRCRDVTHHVSEHYLAFLATTHSCASPKPSACLRLPLRRRSWPVAVSPGWERDLPDVISAELSLRVWAPTPAALGVHSPVSSPKALAFSDLLADQRRAILPTATSVRRSFSRLQPFTHVSNPQVCSPPWSLPPLCLLCTGQSWLLRPRISRVVTFPCSGYANRPNRAIDGKGTSTPLVRQPCRLLQQARSYRGERECVGERRSWSTNRRTASRVL